MLAKITPSLWLTGALCVIMLGLGLFATLTESLLQFDRSAINAGQWWRLFSGQLIHYGVYHLLMNLSALILISFIFLPTISLARYCLLFSTCASSVGLGLYYCNPELGYYAGLSGVLHGLLVAGLLLTFFETPKFNALALLAVTAKLLHEQSQNFNTHHPLLPVPIAIDAHIYGALAGLLCGSLMLGYYYVCSRRIKYQVTKVPGS